MLCVGLQLAYSVKPVLAQTDAQPAAVIETLASSRMRHFDPCHNKQDKDQHLATTAGQALGQLTQTLLNTPQRDGSKLQAALTPSVTALSGAAQQAVSNWGDALRQHLQKQMAPPARPWEAAAPSAAAPATPSVVGLDGQPVQGEVLNQNKTSNFQNHECSCSSSGCLVFDLPQDARNLQALHTAQHHHSSRGGSVPA